MEWVGNNKERYRRHARKCYHKNIDERRRKSRERAREEDRTEYFTQYRDDNRENIKLLRSMPVSYKTYGHQLTVAELPTEDKDGFLVCVCTYCGKHFKPNYAQVRSRITSLKGQTGGACRIYCSDGCKKACPTYEQKSYPRGFRKGTSREVVSELRKMALERDEYECQRCGKRIGEVSLHVHHINGATQNKMIANDLWNVITFCKTCHEWVHTQKGCRHRELKCK
jgi:5-methylcytosine-specific restriction endonuclease McrA